MRRLFARRKQPSRMLVLGLDCAAPELVFDQFRADLPTLSALTDQGTWGRLESSVPCITIPAWTSMLSSCDPGVLGTYGFRNRVDHSYRPMEVVTGASVNTKRVWDYLSDVGRESVVLSVPQTYPPRPINGHLVSGFLTPGTHSAFTYPAVFKQEVLKVAPDYAFDVKDFRTPDKASLLQRLIDFSEVQHKLVLHCLKTKPWDFFIYVHMGIDRLHHGFWRYHDPRHRLHEPGNPFTNAILDYYRMVDMQITQIIELLDDDVSVLIVSDHGVKRMDGGICINEWLWRNGWLALKAPPKGGITRFEDVDVDWSRTRAWAAGGYYGRVFLNVAGREPQGVIPPDHYEQVRDELAASLAAISGANGEPLNTQVMRPQQIYTQVNGVAPDLLVYFGDLHLRAVGSLGHNAHYTLENDTGPDDANHDTHGIFILYEPGKRGLGCVSGHQLMDIAPTILQRMAVPVPAMMQGRIIQT